MRGHGLRRQGRKMSVLKQAAALSKPKKWAVLSPDIRVVAAMAGIRLPIASRPLQALVRTDQTHT